jgi:hypothetical protein
MKSMIQAVKEYHARIAEAEKELQEAREKWEALFCYGREATQAEILSTQEVLMEAEMYLDSVKKGF